VAFSTGAINRFSKGSILQKVAALHVTINHDVKQPSVSAQIAALRNLLSGNVTGDMGDYFKMAANGQIPLVVDTNNADVIATLLDLSDELSQLYGCKVKLTISGGAEAHLLAKELGQAGVGVILTRPRPFPLKWSGRNMLVFSFRLSEPPLIKAFISDSLDRPYRKQ